MNSPDNLFGLGKQHSSIVPPIRPPIDDEKGYGQIQQGKRNSRVNNKLYRGSQLLRKVADETGISQIKER